MKRWLTLIVVLTLLACIVPWSSRRPDAVQRVLGLAGGVDGVIKALGGIVIVMGATIFLTAGLRKLGRKI